MSKGECARIGHKPSILEVLYILSRKVYVCVCVFLRNKGVCVCVCLLKLQTYLVTDVSKKDPHKLLNLVPEGVKPLKRWLLMRLR